MDVILWSAGADIPEHQQGPAAILQLAGLAWALADEIQVAELMHSVAADWNDGQGIAAHPGLHLLVRGLGERYHELEIEVVLRTLIDFMTMRRRPREDIDTALARFDFVQEQERTPPWT